MHKWGSDECYKWDMSDTKFNSGIVQRSELHNHNKTCCIPTYIFKGTCFLSKHPYKNKNLKLMLKLSDYKRSSRCPWIPGPIERQKDH